MSVAGKWQITMETPVGAQEFTWELEPAASGWRGTMVGPTGTSPLTDLRVEGARAGFRSQVASPFGTLDVAFDATVAADQISGSCRTRFGDLPFRGRRL